MPTHLKQHYKRLCTMAETITDDAHCSLRHHHYAMVCYKGRCIAKGSNRKSCSLRESDARNRPRKKQRNKDSTCGSRCDRTRTTQSPPPTAHVLPARHPISYKIKLCRHI